MHVWIFLAYLRSQIFTVKSAEPDANMFLCEGLSERVSTESVWLPSLYFLALLVNFFTFFLFDTS